MSLRQDYNELFEKREALITAAQAAYDNCDQTTYRAKMDEAAAITPKLDQMEADLKMMDASARRYVPPSVGGGAPAGNTQLNKDDLTKMGKDYKAIAAAHRAGRFDNILRGEG